ncbi:MULTISPECIES: alpha-ketoglutarate-dependent dioxygenase AlkB family protein [Methylomonas]|uniref:2OG-Fe(II) oxygenase n=2 Tax=Methylomonas TaxID=416 RepID=A0A126T288_9GAMM|nr:MULTISPECIES: alpha-ketoglutarate-dependent dioxygenase AlkB [Methylomonas]AMK75814.1 2OG-Fe(II) oxygenase [Methylomonas denitrificans]OAH98569.1 2OG-Fe(II) oxygenase [Methylomonas methanica]TCV80171.1 DNA-N1-methyladenine dioxygenase [Methylomonas methanica]
MSSANALLANHQNLAPSDGELYLLQAFYPASIADNYLQSLLHSLAWQTEQIHIYGRWVPVPRLMAWYGDPDADYRYSGVDHQPLPWTTELQTLRTDVETVCRQAFNSVLANLYRDGRDSMGCHADNEKELGPNPQIASLSFGETRLLRFRHARIRTTLNIELSHGDLLIMAGELQHHWRHELPKTRQAKQARINLTFRRIVSTPNSPARSAAR